MLNNVLHSQYVYNVNKYHKKFIQNDEKLEIVCWIMSHSIFTTMHKGAFYQFSAWSIYNYYRCYCELTGQKTPLCSGILTTKSLTDILNLLSAYLLQVKKVWIVQILESECRLIKPIFLSRSIQFLLRGELWGPKLFYL